MLLNTHTLVAWRHLLPSISKSDYVYKSNCDKAPRKPKWQLSVSLLFISFLRHGSFIRQSCCYGRILSRFITSHCWWFKAADGLDIGVSVYNIGQFRNPDVSVWHLKTRMLPQWGQLWLYYTMDNAFPRWTSSPYLSKTIYPHIDSITWARVGNVRTTSYSFDIHTFNACLCMTYFLLLNSEVQW